MSWTGTAHLSAAHSRTLAMKCTLATNGASSPDPSGAGRRAGVQFSKLECGSFWLLCALLKMLTNREHVYDQGPLLDCGLILLLPSTD